MRSSIMEKVKRVVVKIGSQVLTDERGNLDEDRLRTFAEQIAYMRDKKKEVVIVTSGAIAAGIGKIGLKKRPKKLAELQAVAAVGQVHLMWAYEACFNRYSMPIAQILLTAQDVQARHRHLNARNTVQKLLDKGIIPIINENDTVAVDELKFGDNDYLSALVALLIQADLLIILTSVDGLLKKETLETECPEVITDVHGIDDSIWSQCAPKKTTMGLGGIKSKLEAAQIVTHAGEYVLIANGLKSTTLIDVIAGKKEGTLFYPTKSKMAGKKRCIGYFIKPQGIIVIDDGACCAVVNKGKSLLPQGIREIRGTFGTGEPVSIQNEKNREIARGMTNYSSDELGKIIQQVRRESVRKHFAEVIHRDNMVLWE